MIAKYLIEEYKSRAQNCLSKGTLVQISPSAFLKILAELEAAEQTLALDAAKSAANFPTIDKALNSEWVALANTRRK